MSTTTPKLDAALDSPSNENEVDQQRAIDAVFSQLGQKNGWVRSRMPLATASDRPMYAVSADCQRETVPQSPPAPVPAERGTSANVKPARFDLWGLVILASFLLAPAYLAVKSMPGSWFANHESGSATSQTTSAGVPRSAAATQPDTVPIENVQVAERVAGVNPIREQAEGVEPDPATWRKISLHLRKESGLSLWIDLLRPLDWIEAHGAELGKTIELSMPEIGAVGAAEVTYFGPCPPIMPGTGTVVTGKFTHQADAGSHVVRLPLEGQKEATGVTEGHPYWSEDRKEYVEVGRLRIGEMVNTVFGLRRVESVTPYSDYDGLLYNLETTEHVFRVGTLGTLVHNDCLAYAKIVQRRHPDGKIIGMRPKRETGRQIGRLPHYPTKHAHGMGIDDVADHHYFHIKDGLLRDPGSPRGIQFQRWVEVLCERNGYKPKELTRLFDFFDGLTGQPWNPPGL